MGYKSCGSGGIVVKSIYDEKFTLDVLKEMGFEISGLLSSPDYIYKHWLNFQEMRLYNWEEEFQYLIDTCNGELNIEGDDRGDIWKLRFEDGKVEACSARIKYTSWKPVDLAKVLS